MRVLSHPNIVNLVEVIDDPSTDHLYMGILCFSLFVRFPAFPANAFYLPQHYFDSVMEYVEGKWVSEGDGPEGGLGENTARKYLRNVVSGLMYLHAHVLAEFLSLVNQFNI